MLEKYIEKEVSKFARSEGWISYKFVSPSHRSVPDRVYIKNGVVLFVEFKSAGKVSNKGQDAEHRKITNAGIAVYVIDSIESGKEVFR